MGSTRPIRPRLALGLATILVAATARADDLPPLPAGFIPSSPTAIDPPTVPANPEDFGPRRVETLRKDVEKLRRGGDDWERFWFLDHPSHPTPAPKTTPIAPKPPTAPAIAEADPVAERAKARDELARLPRDDAQNATPVTKARREALQERLRRLDEWEKAVKERQAAENPEPNPATLAAEASADLERVKACLDQSAKEPDALLPASFRNLPANLSEANRGEMKDAIDAALNDLKDRTSKLELLRSDPTRKAGVSIAAARALRDKTQQELTGLKARNAERQAALASEPSPEARALAGLKLENGRWETRIAAERLRGQEAALSVATERSRLAGLNLQLFEAHVRLAQKTLDRMKERYQVLAVRQESDLRRKAAREQTRSEKSADPLERYRARRAAEILELEARVVRSENALATSPSPSLEEQRALADRAEADFTNIKKLLDDGKVSHLDALRLNNDFRRLGVERGRIVRHDLAAVEARLTRAENALSDVELELAYGARDDRSELDTLLEHVPLALHPKATRLFEDFENRQSALLSRRREALDRLAQRADLTHQQVLRRLRILDEHFGFIRTHMFWVRDEEPIGAGTLVQAERELVQLGRAASRLILEARDRSFWGRPSVEFLAVLLGLVLLPWPLRQAHQALRSLGPPSSRPTPPPAPAPAPAPAQAA